MIAAKITVTEKKGFANVFLFFVYFFASVPKQGFILLLLL